MYMPNKYHDLYNICICLSIYRDTLHTYVLRNRKNLAKRHSKIAQHVCYNVILGNPTFI